VVGYTIDEGWKLAFLNGDKRFPLMSTSDRAGGNTSVLPVMALLVAKDEERRHGGDEPLHPARALGNTPFMALWSPTLISKSRHEDLRNFFNFFGADLAIARAPSPTMEI
jgi:hypothetical protein